MAIISDGTTEIEIKQINEIVVSSIDKTNKTSSGGSRKQQVSGERLALKCDARTTSTIYRQFLDLMTNGTTQYYYTPETDHPIYSSVITPIPVQFNKITSGWDNRNVYYINFNVESTDYI